MSAVTQTVEISALLISLGTFCLPGICFFFVFLLSVLVNNAPSNMLLVLSSMGLLLSQADRLSKDVPKVSHLPPIDSSQSK